MARRPLLNKLFLLCDVQERFRPLIADLPQVINASDALLKFAAIRGYPSLCTEQYPKTFLHTVKELAPYLAKSGSAGAVPVLEKQQFSMGGSILQYAQAQHGFKVENTDKPLAGLTEEAVLFGIEAHACILQTALDLRKSDVKVAVVVDGVASRFKADSSVALRQMEAAGVKLTTVESLILQDLVSADHPSFKASLQVLIGYNNARPQAHATQPLM